MHIVMPGGWSKDGGLLRELSLRPVTGTLEFAVCEVVSEIWVWPDYVSRLLSLAYMLSDGASISEDQAGSLCVADREYLLLQLARALNGDRFWVTARCAACAGRFDVALRRSELPLKPAGQGFPHLTAAVDDHVLSLRLPTGADQSRVARLQDAEALTSLLHCCLLEVDGGPVPPGFAATLSQGAIEAIEALMDEVSPDVGTRFSACCPDCGAEQAVGFDPFGTGAALADRLLSEVHRLACRYHWSEADILALPRARRQHYLCLIDEAQDVTH